MLVRDVHITFIESPISDILQTGIKSVALLETGMKILPTIDYILSSLFLQLTGAVEQKMKQILWELASNSFECRYEFMREAHGEYSSIKDKNSVLKLLCHGILNIDSNYNFDTEISRGTIIDKSVDCIKQSFKNTNISASYPQEYSQFFKIVDRNNIKDNQLFHDKRIFLPQAQCGDPIKLAEAYESLYRYRNSCAHNTKSYQIDVPTLTTMSQDNYLYQNPFLRFFILILIDSLFLELFKIYRNQLKTHHLI